MTPTDVVNGMKRIAHEVLPQGADALLFGSRARGDAREDSDWDILILINGSRATGADFDKYAYPFVKFGWSIGEQINPLLYSYGDWTKRSITPFYKNVQSEAISLCR
ncbi:MAG: nucleotidyltransferase domain-containing protein [Bacteroidales bacterium]|nr:nucleotidyltransferase domain-containing protein [Bacteroidales bacterium]